MEVKQSIFGLERLNDQMPTGNIFQSREFYEIYRQIGWNPFALVVAEGRKHLGGLLCHIPKGSFYVSRLFPWIFVDSGPILDRDSGIQILDLLLKSLDVSARRYGGTRVDIRAPFPFPEQYEIFRRNSYGRRDSDGEYSVLIDLTKDLDDLWKDLKRGCRKRIKASIRNRVHVENVETLQDLKSLYQIYLTTAKRRLFIPYPFSFFRTMWIRLKPKRLAQFFLAWHEGKPIAGRINVIHNGKVTTFISCSLSEFWKLSPNHILMWHSICRSKEDVRARMFDIFHLPCKKDAEGKVDYYTFKTSFGGTLIRESSYYFRIISQSKYRLVQGMTKNLECFVRPFLRNGP